MFDRLDNLLQRSQEIDALFASPEVLSDPGQVNALAKERSDLQPVVAAYQRLQASRRELADAHSLAGDADAAVAEMAQEEVERLTSEVERLEEELRAALLPRDPNDGKNVIMEIRGGTGGEEAALFASDLFRMYQRYAQRHGLQVDVVSTSQTEQGGLKEIVCAIEGADAYRLLKHESGVHRVQRVPVTEAQGRVHTSTATVAVLPEAGEVDVDLRPEDLRIDIFHSGGPGGQNVNKVATAVRVVHNPTGIMVVSQDERSQLRNKTKALAVLRSRLYEQQMLEQQASTSAARRSQVGSGERSEKVRTYNFPQDRLTDHRIGMSLHGLQEIMAGQIDSLVEALLQDEQARLLAEAIANLGHLIRSTAKRLEAAGVGDARIEADLIWMTALGCDRARLYAALHDAPPEEEARRADALLTRRLNREPMAYLMGRREFFGLDIAVAPGVLVPRPETEAVVEETLRLVEGMPSPVLADVGCGSGAIAVALAAARRDAEVYALDIAPRALEMTASNADAHGVSGRVHVLKSDLLARLPTRVRVLAANLPYVRSADIPTLEPEVQFEPREALDGGDDGLLLMRRMLAQAKGSLLPGGALVMEMDPRQIADVAALAAERLPVERSRVVKDLAGRERVLVVETAG